MNYIKKYWVKFVTGAIITGVIIKLVEYVSKIVLFPYQNEFREGAPLAIYPLISSGGDPYSISNLPQYNDAYGIVYNYLTVPFANLFGNDINAYRFFSFLCFIGSITLIYLALKKLKVSRFLILLGILTYITFTISMDFALAVRPDGLGLMLFLGSIIIPYYLDFSRPSIIFAILISILAFYTKIYYAFGIFYLAVYLFLFKSKLMGITVGILGGAILGFVLLIIRKISDLYFAITYTANSNVGGSEFPYMIKQFREFALYNWPLLLLTILVIGFWIYQSRAKFNFNYLRGFLKSNLNFARPSAPLINYEISPMLIGVLISMAIIYIRLGRGTGTFLTYFFQLISPFFIVLVFELFKKAKFPKRIFQSIIIVCLILGIVFNLKRLDLPRGDSNFVKVENLVSVGDKILASPAVVSILTDKQIEIYDSGQTEYFEFSNYANMEIQSKSQDYKDMISEKIKDKFFDFIIIPKGGSTFAKNELIERYYQVTEDAFLDMPWADGQGQSWDMNVWTRR